VGGSMKRNYLFIVDNLCLLKKKKSKNEIQGMPMVEA
jgi:hypothetical protein